MHKLNTGIIALLVLALAACAKPLPPERAAYVGQWQGQNMVLRITQEGRLAYKRMEGNSTTSVDAPIQGFSGNDFSAGVGPLSTTFKVSAPPHQDGTQWKMTVDGVELTRQP
ncbi:MAG: hypothetical protein JSS44_09535 [Proteobacteria bacterium]|nr:hypothetical protein [Pseudomonadota bacterium]MBS0463849.1 hypothetical protein [Pseudomonadota bacterium]